ncbi:MAG TPA: RluA family pseudouridine synthase [Chitinivibrionales bacterium]
MLDILFENDDILAVNKPEGLACIPTRVAGEPTLLKELSERFPEKIFVVHRIDKEVSGVMLFAKNAKAHKCLNDQFFSRTVLKTYILAACGVIANDKGVICKPLRQFGSGRMGVDEKNGKESITEFSVIARGPEHTLVKAFPRTGRRHQIRVHFYSLGHPIAGELRYGDKATQISVPRLMLHAASITFKLPSGELKTVQAVLPESFKTYLGSIGISAAAGEACNTV